MEFQQKIRGKTCAWQASCRRWTETVDRARLRAESKVIFRKVDGASHTGRKSRQSWPAISGRNSGLNDDSAV